MPSITIETLADHHRGSRRWFKHCDACGRSVQINVAAVIERLGEGYPMAEYRKQVRCKGCGARGLPGVRVHCPSDGRPAD